MSSILLDNIRRINKILQVSGTNGVIFSDLAKVLSQIIDCNVFIAGKKGQILGMSVPKKAGIQPYTEINPKEFAFPDQYNQELLGYSEIQSNIHQGKNEQINITVIPVYSGAKRRGTLIFELFGKEMTIEDSILSEYSAVVAGMEIMRTKNEENEERARNKAVVQLAVETLSFSEKEAVEHIFKELNGIEGLLVASKIADRAGITRSVIVNALRKLESAGIIESRSLGMKGTHIKILNEELLPELKKLK